MTAGNESFRVSYTLYKNLHVRPQVSQSDLKRAYLRVALQHHPDKSGLGAGEEEVEVFRQAKRSYDLLSNPTTRAFYDRYGDSGLALVEGNASMNGPRSSLIDPDTKFGRFLLQICTRPSRLIPFFLPLGFIHFLILLQPIIMDWKLSGSKWFGSLSWRWVLAPLWIVDAFVLAISVLPFILLVQSYPMLVQIRTAECDNQQDESPLNNVPAAKALAVCDLFHAFTYPLYAACFVYFHVLCCEFGLANGGDGLWLVQAYLYLEAVLVVLKMVLISGLLRFRRLRPVRQQISLLSKSLLSAFFRCLMAILLFTKTLSKGSALIWPCTMIVSTWLINVLEQRSLRRELQRLFPNGIPENIDDSTKETIKQLEHKLSFAIWNRWFWTFFFFVSLELVVAGFWDYINGLGSKHWSCTFVFLPTMLMAGISSFMLSFVCPCLLLCMELVLPENQFDRFDMEREGEGREPARPCTLFGYGFAPYQLRLLFNK
jgi:hypothetical protein